MKRSNFRRWVEEIWRENQSERKIWRDTPESLQEYVRKYRWWLKREYRYQQNRNG